MPSIARPPPLRMDAATRPTPGGGHRPLQHGPRPTSARPAPSTRSPPSTKAAGHDEDAVRLPPRPPAIPQPPPRSSSPTATSPKPSSASSSTPPTPTPGGARLTRSAPTPGLAAIAAKVRKGDRVPPPPRLRMGHPPRRRHPGSQTAAPRTPWIALMALHRRDSSSPADDGRTTPHRLRASPPTPPTLRPGWDAHGRNRIGNAQP